MAGKCRCTTTYDVTFPMFSKVEVNGDLGLSLDREAGSSPAAID